MFSANRILNKKREKRSYVAPCDLRVSNAYVPTPIDSFLFSEHENAHTNPSYRVTSDLYMLFNQQRLDRQSRAAMLQYFEDMQVREPSLASLKSKMTDSQLISFVKSRYIQSQSELLNWSRYLNSLGDAELQAILAKLPQDSDDPDPKPADPAPAPAE